MNIIIANANANDNDETVGKYRCLQERWLRECFKTVFPPYGYHAGR